MKQVLVTGRLPCFVSRICFPPFGLLRGFVRCAQVRPPVRCIAASSAMAQPRDNSQARRSDPHPPPGPLFEQPRGGVAAPSFTAMKYTPITCTQGTRRSAVSITKEMPPALAIEVVDFPQAVSGQCPSRRAYRHESRFCHADPVESPRCFGACRSQRVIYT